MESAGKKDHPNFKKDPLNLKIIKAEYGDLPGGPKADVTEKVKTLVKPDGLDLEVSNDLFGDAAPGKVKKFRIEYTIDGVKAEKTVNENDSVTLKK
jgi:hypothetical protein